MKSTQHRVCLHVVVSPVPSPNLFTVLPLSALGLNHLTHLLCQCCLFVASPNLFTSASSVCFGGQPSNQLPLSVLSIRISSVRYVFLVCLCTFLLWSVCMHHSNDFFGHISGLPSSLFVVVAEPSVSSSSTNPSANMGPVFFVLFGNTCITSK